MLQHPCQTLLGDLQDFEQIGNLQPRVAIDEVQHAVMRTPQAELGEHGIGLAGEVAVGEEQQLDAGDELRIGKGRTGASPLLRRSP